MTQLTPRQDPGLRPAHRYATRRGIAAAGVLLLTATGVSAAVGATQITQTNANKLVAVGPVNSEYGFPAWYEDSTMTRTELCLDFDNPFCGLAVGDIPDENSPISFPGNFPEEAFYMLASSELNLPGGGRAVLVLGVEGAFANEVKAGDQVVFGRQRVVVKGGPANTSLTFKHPYGTIAIDTNGSGDGKLVEDVSPAVGNFTAALKSNIGPFLKWDPAAPPAAPAGYLGDPGQTHSVTGSPFGYNRFSVSNAAGLITDTDQFSLMGKISINRGVQADSAVLNGDMIDVFATSEGTQIQVEGQDGQFATIPMVTDLDSNRHYARINFTGAAPTSVKVTNIGDKPVSSSTIDVTKPSGVTILDAAYNGTAKTLSVLARSAMGEPLTVKGFGAMTAGSPYSAVFSGVTAPPANVTVTAGSGGSASLPITVTGGAATEPGQPVVTPQPDPGPVIVTEGGTGTVTPPPPVVSGDPVAVATAASATIVHGGATTLNGDGSTGAVSYKWSQVAGTPATLSSDSTATPTVTMPFFAKTSDTKPVAASTNPVFQLVVTDINGVASKPATVELAIQRDTVTVSTGSRHRVGQELRITGTSTVTGSTAALAPATSVVVYNMTSGTPVKLGNAQVDALGAWAYRAKPGPSVRVTNVMVQSTRGGEVKTAAVFAG